MIASRRTITATPTPRDGSANSGRSDRMLSRQPTRTLRARRAPRQEPIPVTGPGPVSRPAHQPPGACGGDRRRSAVAVTRVRIAVPAVWRRGPGRRVRTSSGTPDRGRRCDRRAGRPRAAIPATPLSVPGTTRKQIPGSQCVRRARHRPNGGRRPTTATGRRLCTCCGAVTAGCSMRTGLADAMRTCCLSVGCQDPMAPAGAMRTCRLSVGCQDPTGPSVAMKDPRGEWVHSRVPGRSDPARRPAVISLVTGTGLTGPVCRRAGSKAAARL